MEHIKIFDTTLRDGEQSPGCSMRPEEKIRMAKQLEQLKVDVVEAGFPIASEEEFASVKAIADSMKTVTVAALCRANNKDIDIAWKAISSAVSPRIHTFIATSEIHKKHKLKMNSREVLKAVKESVSRARRYTRNVEFSAEDASRSELGFLAEVVSVAIEAGATTINLPDTVGYATPGDYGAMFRSIQENVPATASVCLSAHCHNDLGLAVANSLAAIENGATQVECTINGIGERAGNASLEELVMALYVRESHFKVRPNVLAEELYATSQLLSDITGVKVQPHKAIVGDNAFSHEAGIHQDGMLKNALTYEIMTPETVGRSAQKLVMGKHSGRHALRAYAEELGFTLNKNEMQNAYALFLENTEQKKQLNESDLKRIFSIVKSRNTEQSVRVEQRSQNV